MSIKRTCAISRRWVAFDSSGITSKLRLRLGVAQTIPHFGHGFVSFSKCQRVLDVTPIMTCIGGSQLIIGLVPCTKVAKRKSVIPAEERQLHVIIVYRDGSFLVSGHRSKAA